MVAATPPPRHTPGAGRLAVARVGQRSIVREARAESPLRFVLTKNAGHAAWVVTSSFGGGLVRGDVTRLEVTVDEGGALALLTQASTKVYRGSSEQWVDVAVAPGGLAAVLPDPVACFAESSFTQRTCARLAPDASLLLVDAYTSGRAAHGDEWRMSALDSRIVAVVGGRERVWDATRLDERDGSIAARLPGVGAFATVVAIGPRAAPAAEAALALAASPPRGALVAAAPVDGGALTRISAGSAEALDELVGLALGNLDEILGDDPRRRRT